MKKIFFFSACLLLASCFSYGQTVLYNGGTDITAGIGSIIYVDGNVVNDPNGHIHNQGDIHLTKDWTNNESTGCLDLNTGTVFLDGGAQFIKGAQTTTFNNLNCVGSGLKTLNINTIVGGTTGALSLFADPFSLNSKTLTVTNPLPAAITRTSGYIISETDPTAGYGIIDWKIGNTAAGNNYTYPFGTMSGSYVPFLFDLTTAGVQSTTGSMAVATYPTNVTATPNNRPLPTGVANLKDANGNESAAICADRFWITNANNYSTVPKANITFSYVDAEWNTSAGSTNTIVEDSLKAWRWSGIQWLNPPKGTDNSSLNYVAVPSVNNFSIWTLKGLPPCAMSVSILATPTTSITLGLGDTVHITASGGGTYSWSTGATTSSIFVSPTATTDYCVMIKDTSGRCKDSVCITINVEVPCGDFFLPNAFSPNDDSKNDFFRPRSNCLKTLDFKIYNRWGNLVYSTNNPSDKGWDGSTPKGKKDNDGVYAYELNATFFDGTSIVRKGTVSLIK